MSGQNRLLAILLTVLAALVLLVGGLSAVLLFSGTDEVSTIDNSNNDSNEQVTSDATGRLRLGSVDPVTLDPHLATDAGSAEYIVEIFSGLVRISPELEITLDLAESVDISSEGLLYTFALRTDA